MMLAKSPAFNRPLKAISMGAPVERVTGCQVGVATPTFTHVTPCLVGAVGNPSVLFWGDSHAIMLTPAAEWSARAQNRTAIVLGKTSCPPLLGIEVDFFVKRTCGDSNDEILAWIEKQRTQPITGAVLAARWSLYNGKDTPNAEADLPRMVWRDASRPESDYASKLGGGLGETLKALSPGRRVLILAPVPELRHPAVGCLQRAQISGQSRESCAISRDAVENRRHEAMEVLRSVAAAYPNVRLIDPIDVFCDRDKCWPFGPEGVFYVDTDHLSPLGAERLYRHFERDFSWVYGDGPKL